MPDLNSLSWNRFQAAQKRLNLVKAHAHEIVGCKREQVNRVVENFSKPGTYDITVHENGRVFTTQWTPPAFEDAFVPVPFDEPVVVAELEPIPPQELSPFILPTQNLEAVIPDVVSPEDKLSAFLAEEEDRLAEGDGNVDAPESAAADAAPPPWPSEEGGPVSVTVFTTPSCPGCMMTKLSLDRHRIPYETVDLSQDKDAHAYVTGLGYTSAPVVVVDENTHWAGFRPDRIKALVD